MISCEWLQTLAALPRTERGQYLILGGDPKGENFLYSNGNSVFIRNLKDDSISDVYCQHSSRVTVAKYSPSRYYIASADIHGRLRIWDTTQKEHPLKAEYQPFAGCVNDVAWSSDNSKLAIGGEGREKFGAVINIETGTNVGVITGMSKAINNLDLKPTRPFRLAASAEDSTVCFLEGPPFKFKTSHLLHTNFANCLRYSPTGDYFVSAGADGKMFLFDGKDGSHVKEMGDPAHKGGIYSLSFSGDGAHLMSVSGDKTMKIWSIPAGELVREHVFGKEVCHIQLGCLWSGDNIVSVSMPGDLTFFSAANLLSSDPVTPTKLVTGHQKPIISLGLTHNREMVTADSEGRIMKWDVEKGAAVQLGTGGSVKGHGCQVNHLSVSGRELITVGMDDRMILTDLDSGHYREDVKLNSQPRRVHQSAGLTAIACYKELVLAQGMQPVHSFPVKYEPVCLAVCPQNKLLVAGGESDQKLYVYLVQDNGSSLTSAGSTCLPAGHPRDLCFSPDGRYLICGDTERVIHVFNINRDACADGDNAASSILQVHPDIRQKWKYHSARISCVSVSPNSKLVATASLDCSIIVWNLEKPSAKFIVKNAHPMSHANALMWLDDNTLYSVGQDANIKKWHVTLQ